MEISSEVAELLREGLSNAEVSRQTGLHPVKVADARGALGLPSYYGMLPAYVAPDSHRPHGTRAKYFMEKCRCVRCRAANRSASAERERLLVYGRWEPWVDAQPVYAHLRYLQSCGMGLRAIASSARVDRKRLQSILSGRPERGTGPQEKVRPAIAAAIVAVEPTLENLAANAVIDGTGVRRRLQALVAMGWPQMHLAEAMGWTPSNLSVLINATAVTVKTARVVRAVYDRLWNADPLAHGASVGGVTRAKAHAEQLRWAPVGAWDEDALDDPAAFPDWTGHCGTPEGYDAHYSLRIPLCEPCRTAGAERRAERKTRAVARELRQHSVPSTTNA